MTNTDKPIVSYVVLGYNQEQFIEEAIISAFEQSYEPLEIILSDDHSSDRTYAIMREKKLSYHGPHNVILNQNPNNFGIGKHIRKVASIASGDILVMAAGDDISYKDRTKSLVNVFTHYRDTFAVFSNTDKINDRNKAISDPYYIFLYKSLSKLKTKLSSKGVSAQIKNGGGIGSGSSYSYRKECFRWPYPYPSHIDREDRILPLRAALLGNVVYLDKSLLMYRRHSFNYSNSRYKGIIEKPLYTEIHNTLFSAFKQSIISAKQYHSYCDNLERTVFIYSKLLKINSLNLLFVKPMIIYYKIVYKILNLAKKNAKN